MEFNRSMVPNFGHQYLFYQSLNNLDSFDKSPSAKVCSTYMKFLTSVKVIHNALFRTSIELSEIVFPQNS